ncbi:unnamed protein product [Ixodes pacificus]
MAFMVVPVHITPQVPRNTKQVMLLRDNTSIFSHSEMLGLYAAK